MKSLLDLISLLHEAILLALKENLANLSAWLGGAFAAAVLAFFLCGWFCRLWNRHYRFTAWHLVSFLLASVISAYCVLLWPASSRLEQAMRNRIERWQEHLANGTVPFDDELGKVAEFAGIAKEYEGKTEIPWSLKLFLRSRKALIENGFVQNPELPTTNLVGAPGALDVSLAFEYSECVGEFRSMNPFLGARLPVEDEAGLQIFNQKRAVEASKNKENFVTYDWVAHAIGEIIQDQVNPLLADLARWTRIVSLSGSILAIALPGLVSGFISYIQIRTGLAAAGKSRFRQATQSRR